MESIETSITMSSASDLERTTFIRKVYSHLLLAVLGFIALEYLWFSTDVAYNVMSFVAETNWLFFLGAFIGAAWLASRFANATQNKPLQYAGLALYVLAESLIFIPMLYIAQYKAGGNVIETAAYITTGGFLALSTIVFFTNIDLRSWTKYLAWGGIMALGFIVGTKPPHV